MYFNRKQVGLEYCKSVAPGQDRTGEAGSWMSSLEIYSIANEDKNIVWKQRGPFDEEAIWTRNS